MMDNPEDAARVREIKRLLDRIQQLPLEVPEQQAVLRPGSDYQQWQGHAAHADVQQVTRGRASSVSPWVFVLATALNTIVAAVLAVLITLGVVQQGRNVQSLAKTSPLSDVRGPAAASPTQSLMTLTRAVELESIGSPDRPLRLQAQRPVRLPLQIQPEEAYQETFILVLSGLPPKSQLSGAERIGSDSWLVPPDTLGRLELTLAEWSASVIEMGIELRRTSGAIAARAKAWLSVPPPQTPGAVAKVDPAAANELVQRADQLLGRGDIVAARTLYERAAEMGSGPAALALGSTFDPNRLWSLGVFGMVGNKERARHWYARADQLGHPEAKNRLRALE
jgi:hypothetical protein